MDQGIDAWIICLALPMHGLGEMRIWQNDNMARDAPQVLKTVSDLVFESLVDVREQVAKETRKENITNRKKIQHAEKETSKHKAAARRLQKENAHYKALFAATQAAKKATKNGRISKVVNRRFHKTRPSISVLAEKN
ncbi:hypothetical protein AURDEDRAFT_177964 [Auricularia subglabra TFB-10046 SS5]|uniref:Uncharacterized protein n=1 Tax=Auricularia subglabra (strain TFB-10046 / SS5) TaxID=717982 RepID=J0WKY7_AURST|nr:hypothetical protein AURDEDRAFT_177964 [Auricularia subglabra TFB-10046 SS5]